MGELSIQLGFLYAARNDGAEARAWLTRGLADAPRDTDALFLLARLTQSACDFAGAAAIYRRLLALTPNDAAARLGLGACLLELGEDDAGLAQAGAAANAGSKMFGETLVALAACGRGRFWLKPSDGGQGVEGKSLTHTPLIPAQAESRATKRFCNLALGPRFRGDERKIRYVIPGRLRSERTRNPEPRTAEPVSGFRPGVSGAVPE